MYEIDFLPVGDGQNSGDAIAMRFTQPGSTAKAVVTIDAGFKDDGQALVAHVRQHYETDTVDLAVLSHPDGDHIGGMGELVRGLYVKELWLHRIGIHGGESLPAAEAIEDLLEVANAHGTTVYEVWGGHQAFGGAFTILGPSESYYEELVEEQLGSGVPVRVGLALREAAAGVFDRIGNYLGGEVPLLEKVTTPRNNSSMIALLRVDGEQMLFTADAGVPALERAWDEAEAMGLADTPDFVQVAHHGSRRNTSSAWLDRVLGTTGQLECRNAFVSAVAISEKHPSGRVVNAFKRRGCRVAVTAGQSIRHRSSDAPARSGWGPLTPLGPMVEEDDDE